MSNTCVSIMTENPVALKPDMSIKESLEVIRQYPTRYMPVVDEKGDYLGVFSCMTLIRLLLPKSVSLKGGKNKFELDFMTTSLPELKEKLLEVGDSKISEYILTDEVPTCTTKTSIMEALNLLYKHRYGVVLEAGSKKLVGIVAVRDSLKKVLEA